MHISALCASFVCASLCASRYVRVLCVRMCVRRTNNLLYARNISMPVRDECIVCACVCVCVWTWQNRFSSVLIRTSPAPCAVRLIGINYLHFFGRRKGNTSVTKLNKYVLAPAHASSTYRFTETSCIQYGACDMLLIIGMRSDAWTLQPWSCLRFSAHLEQTAYWICISMPNALRSCLSVSLSVPYKPGLEKWESSTSSRKALMRSSNFFCSAFSCRLTLV